MATLITAEVSLNYLQTGDGQPLILIHGLGANLSFWYFGAAPFLARTRSLLMYDLRGHGRSSMPVAGYALHHMVGDLVALLDGRGITCADVAGHSFGGRVALALAALHPHRVRSLVIADAQLATLQPPVRLSQWPHWTWWKTELESQGLFNLPAGESIIDHRLLMKLSQAHGNIASQGRSRISLRTRDMGDKGLQRWRQLLTGTSADRDFEDESLLIPSTLRAIGQPTLLLFGEFSHCMPTADRLVGHLPNARLIVVPGAGHFFPVVRPRLFARVVETFLARRAAASPAARSRKSRAGARSVSV